MTISSGVPGWVFYLSGCVYAVIFILGLIINGAIMYVSIANNLVNKNARQIYHISMYACCLVVICFAMPLGVSSSFAHSWLFDVFGCTYYAFVVCFMSYVIIGLFVAISIDHYITVVKPNIRRTYTRKTTAWITFACFIHGFVMALFPIIGWSSYTFEGIETTCSIHWLSKTAIDLTYSWFLNIEMWVVPLAVMIYAYSMILVEMRLKSKRFRRLLFIVRRRRKVVKTSVAVTMSFVVSWTPYAIMSVYALISKGGGVPLILQVVPHMTAKASVLLIPLMQVYMNKDLRREIKRKCICFPNSLEHGGRLENLNLRLRNYPAGEISLIPREASAVDGNIPVLAASSCFLSATTKKPGHDGMSENLQDMTYSQEELDKDNHYSVCTKIKPVKNTHNLTSEVEYKISDLEFAIEQNVHNEGHSDQNVTDRGEYDFKVESEQRQMQADEQEQNSTYQQSHKIKGNSELKKNEDLAEINVSELQCNETNIPNHDGRLYQYKTDDLTPGNVEYKLKGRENEELNQRTFLQTTQENLRREQGIYQDEHLEQRSVCSLTFTDEESGEHAYSEKDEGSDQMTTYL